MRKVPNLQKPLIPLIPPSRCFDTGSRTPESGLLKGDRGIISDTITAISTPMGEGGIGIVRLSGPGSLEIADEIFKGGHSKEKPSQFSSYTTHYGYILNGKERIDEVILTVMRAPKTYTREDVVEINCHGGIVPLRKVLELVVKKGARIAQPGEFTKRAFLNGRIDLAQAEAVADVVRAKTELSLKTAMEQLQGGLSATVKKIRERLLDILARMEASIDFPEEDVEIPPNPPLLSCPPPRLASGDAGAGESKKGGKEGGLETLKTELEKLLLTFDKGRMLREGVTVAIIGRPNVGKSSLMNAMLGEERAIVTSIPGTTTDTIEETINIEGAQIRIVDTAGIGSKPNVIKKSERSLVETEGVKRAEDALKKSELILLVMDGSQSIKKEDRQLLEEIKNKKAIVFINKIDLPQKVKPDNLKNFFAGNIVEISAKEKINIDKVHSAICDMVWGGKIDFTSDIIMTNVRHKELVSAALGSLGSAVQSNADSPELVALDLRETVESLGKITGETITEEILDRIFENFCIGK